MFSFEYDFFPDLSNVDITEYYDHVLSSFLGMLTRNGQIIDQHWNIIQIGNMLRCYCLAIDEDSLESKYYNKYCKEYLLKLNQKSIKSPEYRLVGRTVGASDACSCEDSNWYILFTTAFADYPPITCGDCNLPVPLYKFPKIDEEEEYYPIFQWEGEYQSCDSLFMFTGVGEQFGYRQTAQATSELTKEGLELCKKMSEKTGKPFYYFLRKYYSPPKNTCPVCGGKWKLEKEINNLYKYKCDKCNILSERPR